MLPIVIHIVKGTREKGSIIITHVFFIFVYLFVYSEVLSSLRNILDWRIFFDICFRTGLLTMNSLSSSFSENVFILKSLLKDMCAAYRIPSWKFFSLQTWQMLFHCFLITLVSGKKPSGPSNCCSHICYFFFCLLSIFFSLSLVSINLNIVGFFFSLFFVESLQLYIFVLHQIYVFVCLFLLFCCHYVFRFFSCTNLFLCFFGDLNMNIRSFWYCLMGTWESQLFTLFLFSLCWRNWVNFIGLPSKY